MYKCDKPRRSLLLTPETKSHQQRVHPTHTNTHTYSWNSISILDMLLWEFCIACQRYNRVYRVVDVVGGAVSVLGEFLPCSRLILYTNTSIQYIHIGIWQVRNRFFAWNIHLHMRVLCTRKYVCVNVYIDKYNTHETCHLLKYFSFMGADECFWNIFYVCVCVEHIHSLTYVCTKEWIINHEWTLWMWNIEKQVFFRTTTTTTTPIKQSFFYIVETWWRNFTKVVFQ